MKPRPKVGRCVWCGHWGLQWGRWCKHPWKNTASVCRLKFNRWVRSQNSIAQPLPNNDFIALGPEPAPDVFGRVFRRPNTSIFMEGPPLTADYGRMRKRHL
jgi:hypothetical protein